MIKKVFSIPIITIVILLLAAGVVTASILVGTTSQGETNTQSINLQKGLIGWWKFDGNAKDATLYANNGTVTEAILTTDRKGQSDKAYDFDGTNDIIQTANGISVFNIASEITYSAWFYVDTGNSGWQRPFQKFQDLSGGNAPPWAISYGMSTAATFGCEFKDSDDAEYRQFESSSSSPAGAWYHVTCVASQSAGTFDIYVNGVDTGGSGTWFTSGTIHTQSRPITIGGARFAGTYWNGKIDDVRIYNRALSATEITALYQEYDPGIVISDLQKGLVGNWDMNGNAKDKTLYANNGTVTGAVLANDRKGQAQKAYGFNGSSKIDLGDVTILNGATTASWSFWFKLNSVTAERAIIARELSTNPTRQFSVTISTSRELRFSAAGALLTYSGTNTMPLSTWTHVVVTYDGTQAAADRIKYYSNGSSLSYTVLNTVPTSLQTMTGVNLFIGHREANSLYFDGDLDDVRMYNRALSATEITALYQEYNPGIQVSDLQKGLVGNWDMNGNAKDKTLYANNGTVTGATLTTDRKGQTNKAYSFDGNDDIAIPYSNIGGTVTYSLWVSLDDTTLKRFFSFMSTLIQINGANELKFYPNVNTGAVYTKSYTFTTGVFYHIVITHTGSTSEGFVNGVSLGSAATQAIVTDSYSNYIGRYSGNYHNGDIDDVRIYNRALSATEVQQLYESY